MGIPQTETNTFRPIGERIKKIRLEKGLSQEALAGREFTKGYVSALERGTTRASLKALDVFARRLGVPISEFLSVEQQNSAEPKLEALEDDLQYQIDYAKILIRTHQMDEALSLLAQAERKAQPYLDKLSASTRYLLPFVRGVAYLQQMDYDQAQPELERAFQYAKDDVEAATRVRNSLGVIFFEKELPQLALEQHLKCLDAIQGGKVKDLNLHISVYRNLAKDYEAINNLSRAIDVYKEALVVLKDVDDMERQARFFWDSGMAYRKAGDWTHAKLYSTRALHIFEAADSMGEAASMCLHMSEILLDEKRYEDVGQYLERANVFLAGTGNQGLLSALYRNYADLARKQGNLEQAVEYAQQSIRLAQALLSVSKTESDDPGTGAPSGKKPIDRLWLGKVQTYAEALHVAALIEEAQGNKEGADRFFQEALNEMNKTGLAETTRSLAFSYADILSCRGDYKRAMEYYRAAAVQLASRSPGIGSVRTQSAQTGSVATTE